MLAKYDSWINLQNVTVKEILSNSDFYADLLARNKVLGFVELRPYRRQHEEILVSLMRGEGDRSFGPIWDVTHPHLENVLPNMPDDFLVGHWHADNTVWEESPTITSMHMHTWTGEKGKGNTVLVDCQKLYEKCPSHLRDYLQDLMLLHRSGANDPETGELAKGAVHPALRTHSVTGGTSLFYTGPECDPVDGETELFNEYKTWLNGTQVDGALYDQENQIQWEWSEGDLLIWDNSCMVHGFLGGWKYGERVFDKLEGQWAKPEYSS